MSRSFKVKVSRREMQFELQRDKLREVDRDKQTQKAKNKRQKVRPI